MLFQTGRTLCRQNFRIVIGIWGQGRDNDCRNVLLKSSYDRFMRGERMATVSHLLANKNGCRVLSVSPNTTVFNATRLMNAEHIGALVVVQTPDIGDELVSIFTERDVLRRMLLQEDSLSTPSLVPL